MLKAFKLNVEKNEKLGVIASYSKKLSDEVLEEYRAKVDEFTLEVLKKELAFSLVEANPSLFTAQEDPHYVPKDNGTSGGIEEILAKYKK